MPIIIFLIILAALVLVHEFGHFIVAKRSGIRVDEFGLGFPPRLWSVKKGETVYSINAIPFGGFVKIFGENPDEESLTGKDSPRSFIHKNRLIQAGVLVAGVTFNVLFAWVLLSISFTSGILASSSDYSHYGDRFSDPHVAIIAVTKGGPADLAGIKAGDTIESITSGKDSFVGDKVTVSGIQGFVTLHANREIKLGILRGNDHLQKTLTAKEGIVPGRVAVGIAMDDVGILRLPVHLALWEGGRLTIHMIVGVAQGLWDFISHALIGRADFSSVSGPVGIVGLVGDATRLGFSYLLSFTALISINLALINLIPFPALDGGRLLFVGIEAIRRKTINPAVANTINMVGFSLLIILMLVVTYRDILKLVH